MPGVLIFGSNGCKENYDINNVHFGENIHAIGLQNPAIGVLVSKYYKMLYTHIIKNAVKEGKIDHLILNGIGDGHFANDETERANNALARLNAIIECKDLIIQRKMKITLTDYANNFQKISEGLQTKIVSLSGIDFEILSGTDGDLQGQALANRVIGSEYVGLVNASDSYQYGCYFITMEGDHTVEERIWNQMFFGLH